LKQLKRVGRPTSEFSRNVAKFLSLATSWLLVGYFELGK
jgi:hypothetical protein